MKFDYRKLLGRITEKLGTQSRFAEKMGLSERTVSLKLNGRVPFKQDEICMASDVLDIAYEEISDYFFTPEVQSD